MTGILNRLIAFVLAITITFISPLAAFAQAAQTSPAVPAAPTPAAKPATGTPSVAPNPGDPWPRAINYQGATISVFQPQVESWAGNELKAYSAVRVKTATKQDTDYGVIWFSARTEVDKVNRMVTLENFVLNKQSFPTLLRTAPPMRMRLFWIYRGARPFRSTCSKRRWPLLPPLQRRRNIS